MQPATKLTSFSVRVPGCFIKETRARRHVSFFKPIRIHFLQLASLKLEQNPTGAAS
jgi:hypothetical protein